MRTCLIVTAAAVSLLPAVTFAQNQAPVRDQAARADDNSAFGLGEIVVTGRRAEGVAIGGDTIGQEAIYAFNRPTLDDAVNLDPRRFLVATPAVRATNGWCPCAASTGSRCRC